MIFSRKLSTYLGYSKTQKLKKYISYPSFIEVLLFKICFLPLNQMLSLLEFERWHFWRSALCHTILVFFWPNTKVVSLISLANKYVIFWGRICKLLSVFLDFYNLYRIMYSWETFWQIGKKTYLKFLQFVCESPWLLGFLFAF